MSTPHFVIDWDGTATECDTLSEVLAHFVDPAVLGPLETQLDAALAEGRLSLRDVMAAEFAELTAALDDVVAFVVERARLRPGFAEFVARFDPLILSTSFHETIAPVLARERITARVVASSARPTAGGWTIAWVATETCAVCGESCKRTRLPAGTFMYVGDGYSDRCAAQRAERIFARDGLARYLDTLAIPYEPFRDFHDVLRALG